MVGNTIFEDNSDEIKRAAVVSVITVNDGEAEISASLDELERLLETAGAVSVFRMTQSKGSPDVRTYIGSGKISELYDLCKSNEVKLVVFDDELTPSQIKNLEDDLKDIQVIDRSMLILDIFALHASTSEGKLQVELAQLKYTIPRLIGKGTELSRLGGGIGTRGPGESKLETDRRHIKRRMAALSAELDELERNRTVQRQKRNRSGLLKVAIAGYTNAGKSTLLNYLTGAGILAEDKLFATLDPTTRKYTLPDGTDILLTDTVGFIRNLPHHLIKAFKSTLDEVSYADVIIVLIDAGDPQRDTQLAVTSKLLSELSASGTPTVYAYNKCDTRASFMPSADIPFEDIVYISAKTGDGVDTLISKLEAAAKNGKTEAVFDIPHSDASALNLLHRDATVHSTEYGDEFITVTATADAKLMGILKKYLRKT